MHRTLKHDVPTQPTFKAQQRCFDTFVEQYNWQRSHEALARQTPGSVHRTSTLRYTGKIPEIEYGSGITVRQVRHNGEIKWHGHLIYVAQILAQEPVGLKQLDYDHWEVRYGYHLLGVLNERTQSIVSAKSWQGANFKKT